MEEEGKEEEEEERVGRRRSRRNTSTRRSKRSRWWRRRRKLCRGVNENDDAVAGQLSTSRWWAGRPARVAASCQEVGDK